MYTYGDWRDVLYKTMMDSVSDIFTDDGVFVLRNGSRDFGEITSRIASMIGRQSGKIRFKIGDDKTGQAHIDGRKGRLSQLSNAGYRRSAELIADVSDHFNAIYRGRGSRLLLAITNKKPIPLAVIELAPDAEGDFYDVITARVSRQDTFRNEKPLWERAQSNHGVN